MLPISKNKLALSDVDEKAILDDFSRWSDGFKPSEVPWKGHPSEDITIENYLRYAMSTKYSEEAVRDFLKRKSEE